MTRDLEKGDSVDQKHRRSCPQPFRERKVKRI